MNINNIVEKIKRDKILVLKSNQSSHVSMQDWLSSSDSNQIELDLEKWKFRTVSSRHWGGDRAAGAEGYYNQSSGDWQKLPEEFVLVESRYESSNCGHRERFEVVYYSKRDPKNPVTVYAKHEDTFQCATCNMPKPEDFTQEDAEHGLYTCSDCPYNYEEGINPFAEEEK